MTQRAPNCGFSLLEIVTVVVILGVMAAMLAPLGANLMDADRSTRANNELHRIYTAIVGDPAAGTFGYLGDVGDYPASLIDLVQDPGLAGWSGPYLTDVVIENDVMVDPFGSPYEYFNPTNLVNEKDQLVVISRGPDRASTFNDSGSPNPNERASFNGTLPTGNYYSGSGNTDNIVYPRFIDNAALIEYQSLGTLSINITATDYNATWPSPELPGCPGMFRVTMTPVTRSANYLQFDYSPGGGATVDLLQGTYKVRVTSNTPSNSEVWSEQISIQSNARVSRNLTLPGGDSSGGSTYTLTVYNNMGAQIRAFEAGNALSGGLNNGNNANYNNINGCAQISIRYNSLGSNGQLLDSFIYPSSGSFTIRYHTSVYNATVRNIGGVNDYVVAYKNGRLLGVIGSRGNRRSKTFAYMKQNDSVTFYDGQAGSLDAAQAMPGSDHTFDY